MKLKHLLLFIGSCVVLIISELTAGSLIALGLLFQLLILINFIPLTKVSQIAALKLFLFSIPTFFFWGGVHSFIQIYFFESSWVYFLTAIVITLALCVIISLQCILAFRFLEESGYNIGIALQKTFNGIQNDKSLLFKTTGLVFVLSLIPWLTTDWKLIFSVTVTNLILNWNRLKPVIVRSS